MAMSKTQKLIIAVYVLLFLVLITCGVGLFLHRPEGSGPTVPKPMVKETQNLRTGAMHDPGREVRGIWIPSVLNITFPSQPGLSADAMRAELEDIVQTARDANLNTICLQVRPSSDALYPSALFPTSAYLSGTQGMAADESFDPLAYLCEIAADDDEDEALAVYAWVNPLRVTSAGQDTSTLSADNPAVQHPEWTFTYNGAVYYNAGIPEVRELIAAGVKEICENYPVAGVIFDDYFYPYPAYGADGTPLSVDDADTYAMYGEGYQTIDDFRRENVNQLVKACYDAVKSISAYIQFGIAPFGIWQNDDGTNGGSDTGGMEAYESIYCDAVAWMKGGYIDFIAPQIYWQFTTSVARYDTLVRWWNARCDAYDIPMWISHAIYNYETWATPGEMRNQITFARSEISYRGSLFYGYPQLQENTLGVADEIRGACEEDILYYKKETVSEDSGVDMTITMPPQNSRFDYAGTYLLGQSDAASELYCDGEPVSRTRSGYFALYKTLSYGENTFVFTQNGEEYRHTIWNGMYAPVTEDEAPEETTESHTETGFQTEGTTGSMPLVMSAAVPDTLTAVPAQDGLSVSIRATAGAAVSVLLDGTQTALMPGETLADGTAVYSTVIALPAQENGQYHDCGNLTFRAVLGEQTMDFTGGQIYSLGTGSALPVTVVQDGTFLKIAPNSWYYDDYIPTSAGMMTTASEIRDGYAYISIGGQTAYLAADGIVVSDTAPAGMAQFGDVSIEPGTKETLLRFPSTEQVPVNCMKYDETFRVTLYRGHSSGFIGTFTLSENPLLSDVSVINAGEEEAAYATYTFSLRERDRFYGFRVCYEEDAIVIALRNPQTIDLTADMPLAGKTIVLDAGHGGTDTGTLTPGSHLGLNEKECNLAIVLETEKKLTALGAEVLLLRADDTTVDIYTRMDEIDEICPDLLLSIHQNSMTQDTDISHIRGVVGLYWTESGRSLADCVAAKISEALGRLKRDTTGQRLAMLRNYKFPAALIEIGFVTYPEEFEVLNAPGGYEKTADAICEGILAWYESQQ